MDQEIGVKRPKEVQLIDAIKEAIYEIAPGQMTPVEVLGVLDMVARDFYMDEIQGG